jgi:hypothetical protein
MTDVTVHVASSAWCVHFVITITQIPLEPWLLFGSSDEIKAKVFTWGDVSAEQIQQYETDLRRWGIGNVHMLLTDQQLHSLAERKRGWPWNGYELIQMRNAGQYPPKRLLSQNSMPTPAPTVVPQVGVRDTSSAPIMTVSY